MSALDWRWKAACTTTDADELFHPQTNTSPLRAKLTCAQCPVIQECLDWALTHHEPGIWGGRTADERKRMRPGQKALPLTVRCQRGHVIMLAGQLNGRHLCKECYRERGREFDRRQRRRAAA